MLVAQVVKPTLFALFQLVEKVRHDVWNVQAHVGAFHILHPLLVPHTFVYYPLHPQLNAHCSDHSSLMELPQFTLKRHDAAH